MEDRLRSLGWSVSLAPNPATIRATGPGCGVFVSFSGEEPEGVRIRELDPSASGERERCLRGGWPGLEGLPSPEAASRLLGSLDPGEQRRL